MRKNNYFFAAIAAMVMGLGISGGVRADTIVNLGVPHDFPVNGETVDPVTQGNIGSAIFGQNFLHSSGTGVFDPFLRLQMKDYEQGYNTSAKHAVLDDKEGIWTHDLETSWLQPQNISGTDYYGFTLDINQDASGVDAYLSLMSLVIFQSNTASLNDVDTTTFASPSGATSVRYDMNAGGQSNRVDINYLVNSSGSGTADMILYVPTSLFNSDKYVYLYSAFGFLDPGKNYLPPPYLSDSGFEEWAAIQGPGTPVPVPLPQAAWLGIVLVGGIVSARKLRSRRNAAIA
jgi:hypothetical protein